MRLQKKVAVATKEGDNAACRLIFRSTINIMFVIGIASAALMYLFAPLLAGISPIANVNNGILAIRKFMPIFGCYPDFECNERILPREKRFTTLWNFFDY